MSNDFYNEKGPVDLTDKEQAEFWERQVIGLSKTLSDYKSIIQVKTEQKLALEAKNVEFEKKLEAVEMVHSNYVNVSCDLYSTLEKKLEIATDCLKELRPVIEQGEDWELGKWIDEALSKIKSEGL